MLEVHFYTSSSYHRPLQLASKMTNQTPQALSSAITIITSIDVESILSTLDPELAVQSQRNAFLALHATSARSSNGIPSVQGPARIALRSEQMTSLFMPARVAEAGGMTCKIVSVPTNGGGGGLPSTTVVLDETTGKVKALVNARKLTGLRNACGTSRERVSWKHTLLLPLAPPSFGARADS